MRKALVISVCFLIFLQCFTIISFADSSGKNQNSTVTGDASIGSYVQFGKYNGTAILWRVINNGKNGTLLFSDNILTLKAFDAKEEDDGESDRSFDDFRPIHGSNYYPNSNLREWLNSDNKKVSYSTQAPTSSHVSNGYNNYSGEPGFLNNFTSEEKESIMATSHKVILHYLDEKKKDGGTKGLLNNESIEDVIENYDESYYKMVEDKVFPLSTKELHDYVYDNDLNIAAYMTEEAYENNDYRATGFGPQYKWAYWLRTPYNGDNAATRYVNSFELVTNTAAYDGTIGVRPALNLKTDLSLVGDGTLKDPYVLGESNVFETDVVDTAPPQNSEEELPPVYTPEQEPDNRDPWEYGEPGVTAPAEEETPLEEETPRPSMNYEENKPHEGINVKIDGHFLDFGNDTKPSIVNGRTLVPFRAIFEALGATVAWDGNSRTAIGQKDSIKVELPIGNNTVRKNGIAMDIDVPAMLLNGRTMVPVRFIAQSLGYVVGWDNVNQIVEIAAPQESTGEDSEYYRDISISDIDYVNEIVTIVNKTDEDINLGGWVLKNTTNEQLFRFPQSIVIEAHDSIYITSGENAQTDATHIRWSNGEKWNDTHNRARLTDDQGNLVALYPVIRLQAK